MAEGGVCLWDLDEPQARHPLQPVGQATLCLRRPSYSTEHLAGVEAGGSAAPIVAVSAVARGGRGEGGMATGGRGRGGGGGPGGGGGGLGGACFFLQGHL